MTSIFTPIIIIFWKLIKWTVPELHRHLGKPARGDDRLRIASAIARRDATPILFSLSSNESFHEQVSRDRKSGMRADCLSFGKISSDHLEFNRCGMHVGESSRTCRETRAIQRTVNAHEGINRANPHRLRCYTHAWHLPDDRIGGISVVWRSFTV